MRELIYVAESGVKNPVFESQVVNWLRGIGRCGVRVYLAAIEIFDVRMDDEIRQRLGVLRPDFSGLIHMRGMPQVGRLTSRWDAFRLAGKAEKQWGLGPRAVVHARGHFGSFTALSAFKGRRVVSDLRGLVSEEVRRYPGLGMRKYLSGFRTREIETMERRIMDRSDCILCVSEAFKGHLMEKYPAAEKKIGVIPTVVDTDRFRYDAGARERLRGRLGIGDRTVFVYSGGLSGWQLPGKVVGLFLKIKKRMPAAFLIFLTHHPQAAGRYLHGLDEKDYFLGRSAHAEVPGYLNAADVGLILREDSPVNRVAAPVKFGEYLCCGLPVLITKGVGDTERIVAGLKAGWLLDHADSEPDVERISLLPSADRRELAEKAARLFSIRENVKKAMEVYERLE